MYLYVPYLIQRRIKHNKEDRIRVNTNYMIHVLISLSDKLETNRFLITTQFKLNTKLKTREHGDLSLNAVHLRNECTL
jgi:hypothetical protein